ncbi:MAG: TatD family hydrolase [Clostridia bacterium]
MIFDTHAHYDDEKFNGDRDEVLHDLKNHGVGLVLNAGCDVQTSIDCVKMAEDYDFCYATVGFHPHSADEFEDKHIDWIKEQAKHEKVVAIGEIGLDYFYDNSPREIQKQVFRTQLAIANELDMPVVIHDRDAHKDCLDIIMENPPKKLIYHCFSGSVEYAEILVKMGYKMSFGGAITFKNARVSQEVIKAVPIESIMLETDAPYLTPVPFRGKRNDSRYLNLVVEKIAELKGISYDEVVEITTKNGREFFGI